MLYRIRDFTGRSIEELAERHTWEEGILTLYLGEQVIAQFTDPRDWYRLTERPRSTGLAALRGRAASPHSET